MHVFAEMVEIQSQSIQFREVQLHLLSNPGGTVNIGHPLLGLTKTHPIGLVTHQSPRGLMVPRRHRHVLMTHVLAVEVHHFELLPRLIGSAFAWCQRPALPSTPPPLLLDLLTPLLLLRL